ncbi:PIN domain-containing protein [Sphingomonas sp. SORGH_AS_0438]|uniref:PIN domain-containing protein n=1 Tax=Sphingomonas sp. SORGH_AS_0438 TaxID=3041756 RepID=UPI002864E052|nr:PIN domain-containing protein [Sphingomonas sp. SORGH_AS_0438]MDR6128062.1 uncharacterized coiled-coil DUF342 family protein [Sphingomonas sp. SORGH_AS_0438]
MKDLFPWHFSASKEEVDDAWSNGVLVVDTNVLLDIYRSPAESAEEIIAALERWKSKKWLPNIIADEFLKNRKTVIAAERHSTNHCIQEFDKLLQSNKSKGDELKNKYRRAKSAVDELFREIEKARKSFSERLRKEDSIRHLLTENDPLLSRILKVFNDCVGGELSEQESSQLFAEAKIRYASKVPPGFADEKTKKSPDVYSDFIIWHLALQRSKELGVPLVFVTSEIKEDWMLEIDREYQPLSALIREGIAVTGKRVLVYRTDQFVSISGERSNAPVDKNVITDIKDAEDKRANSAKLNPISNFNDRVIRSKLDSDKVKYLIARRSDLVKEMESINQHNIDDYQENSEEWLEAKRLLSMTNSVLHSEIRKLNQEILELRRESEGDLWSSYLHQVGEARKKFLSSDD